MYPKDIYTLDDLVSYLVDNGLSEEEANHLIHKKFMDLEYKSLMQLLNYKEFEMVQKFTKKYMLGEPVR